MNLHHVSLKTSNLQGLYTFYMNFFCSSIHHKFKNAEGECYGYMLNFKGAGIIELLQAEKPSNGDGLVKSNHFCLAVSDLNGFLSNFPKDLIYSPPKLGKTDGVYQVMIRDPDGNLIEIHQSK